MGRVKGSNIKRLAKQILEKFKAEFTIDFTGNKRKLEAIGLKLPKIELNKLAGQITVLVKKETKKVKETSVV